MSMKQYYYDTWVEDGATDIGYREVGFFQPTKLKKKSNSEISEGDAVTEIHEGPITRTQIVKYAAASYDYNPIHHDEVFAKRARSGGIIAHGMMIMGYVAKCATWYLGTAEFDKMSMRSVNVTRPGDVVTVGGRVEKVERIEGGGKVSLSLVAKNQHGEPVGIGTVTATLLDKH